MLYARAFVLHIILNDVYRRHLGGKVHLPHIAAQVELALLRPCSQPAEIRVGQRLAPLCVIIRR